MTRLLEHPRVLLSIFLAGGLAVGALMIRLTAPVPHAHAVERPPPHLLCGHAVSEWLEQHDQE